MSQVFASVAAATAIVGYNLLKDVRERRSNDRDRIITAVKLAGSAAANDTEIEIFVEQERIAQFRNTNTGVGNADDIQPVKFAVRAGDEIFAIVTDAPVTNPINLTLTAEDYPAGSL